MSFVYGVGIASWDEGTDLLSRFGESWKTYRQNVHDWRARFKPWHCPDSPPARLYIAEGCGPCSEIRHWFEVHHAIGLQIVAAEDHPSRDLWRMTYDPMDGSETEEGVSAFARGLEHINLAWALTGALMRLPVVSSVIQLLIDASGLGPQLVARRSAQVTVCARTMASPEK
jgi:hypothetical protein